MSIIVAVCVTVAVLGIAYGVGKFLGDLGHALTDDPAAEAAAILEGVSA